MNEKRNWTDEELDKLLEEIRSKNYTLPPLLAAALPSYNPPVDDNRCKHPNIQVPEFDSKVAANLSSHEVRRLFPRGSYYCADCKSTVITYASMEHYLSGDW